MGIKKQNALAFLGLAAAFSEENKKFTENYDPIKPVIHLPKEKPIPRGAKEYFFNAQGEFSTEQMLKTETVFKCVAINDKSAIKKFERWKSH
jgi:hypothetical protein